MNVYEILLRPILTEKSSLLMGSQKYVFEVAMGANKFQIKRAVESHYGVEVKEVNTLVVKPHEKNFRTKRMTRPGRTASYKKAVVTLKSGTIDFMK